MEFEWDSEKAETNEAKHGVSFHSAADLDWASALFVPQVVRGERRIGAFAPIGDRLHFCVYVLRGERCRIISLRKANAREVRRYLEARK